MYSPCKKHSREIRERVFFKVLEREKVKKIKKKFKFSNREVRFDQEGSVELVKLDIFPTFPRD